MSLVDPALRRREPYTADGIGRVRCSRPGCERRASQQWNICAEGNVYRAVCSWCDLSLSLAVLRWLGDPAAESKLDAYARRLGVDLARVRAAEATRAVA